MIILLEEKQSMEKQKIERINHLARKSKSTELTENEKAEQASLRAEYVAEMRASLRGTLEVSVITRPDGSRESVADRKKSRNK